MRRGDTSCCGSGPCCWRRSESCATPSRTCGPASSGWPVRPWPGPTSRSSACGIPPPRCGPGPGPSRPAIGPIRAAKSDGWGPWRWAACRAMPCSRTRSRSWPGRSTWNRAPPCSSAARSCPPWRGTTVTAWSSRRRSPRPAANGRGAGHGGSSRAPAAPIDSGGRSPCRCRPARRARSRSGWSRACPEAPRPTLPGPSGANRSSSGNGPWARSCAA